MLDYFSAASAAVLFLDSLEVFLWRQDRCLIESMDFKYLYSGILDEIAVLLGCSCYLSDCNCPIGGVCDASAKQKCGF